MKGSSSSELLGREEQTRPFRPQTNGKVERFNLTLKWEWAYARPYDTNASRAEALDSWLHHYNYHRPHIWLMKAEHRSRS